MNSYRLTFVTPLFSKGSYDDRPEVRPPSIRGQLHWWFRALGGSYDDEKSIFGGVHGGATASKVVVRVSKVAEKIGQVNTLPHKSGGEASPKIAYLPGTTADIHFSLRLGGLDDRHQQMLERTIETWLLLGTLGLRSTRAAGSFVWESLSSQRITPPSSLQDYVNRVSNVLQGAPLRFVISREGFRNAEEARRIVSDTLGGRNDHRGQGDLSRLRDPLGRASRGRKTSPLRFRIIRVAEDFHIAAIWDDRAQVTGNQPGDFKGVIDLLASRSKPIGHILSPLVSN